MLRVVERKSRSMPRNGGCRELSVLFLIVLLSCLLSYTTLTFVDGFQFVHRKRDITRADLAASPKSKTRVGFTAIGVKKGGGKKRYIDNGDDNSDGAADDGQYSKWVEEEKLVCACAPLQSVFTFEFFLKRCSLHFARPLWLLTFNTATDGRTSRRGRSGPR